MLVDILDKVGTGEVAPGSPSGQRYPEERKQPIFLVLERGCSAASVSLLLFLTRKGTCKSCHFVITSIAAPEMWNAINNLVKIHKFQK